jgi:hypothetical protein
MERKVLGTGSVPVFGPNWTNTSHLRMEADSFHKRIVLEYHSISWKQKYTVDGGKMQNKFPIFHGIGEIFPSWKIPPTVPNEMNPFHTLTSYFFQLHLILSSRSRLPSDLFHYGFPPKVISHLFLACYVCVLSHASSFRHDICWRVIKMKHASRRYKISQTNYQWRHEMVSLCVHKIFAVTQSCYIRVPAPTNVEWWICGVVISLVTPRAGVSVVNGRSILFRPEPRVLWSLHLSIVKMNQTPSSDIQVCCRVIWHTKAFQLISWYKWKCDRNPLYKLLLRVTKTLSQITLPKLRF